MKKKKKKTHPYTPTTPANSLQFPKKNLIGINEKEKFSVIASTSRLLKPIVFILKLHEAIVDLLKIWFCFGIF